jgi:hypothetical protein
MNQASALLVGIAVTLVACGTTKVVQGSSGLNAAGGSLPSASAGTPGQPTPTVVPTPTKPGGGHTGTTTPPSHKPSASPSVSASASNPVSSNYLIEAQGNCFWLAFNDGGNKELEIGAQFEAYYVGPSDPTTMNFTLTNSLNVDNSHGTEPLAKAFTASLGTELIATSPFLGKTVTLTGTINPTLPDDKTSDNSASVTVKIPLSGFPTSSNPVSLSC